MTPSPLELVETKNFEDFLQVVNDLTSELGTRFPESIRNWCGIGQRPYPLDYWRIFLIRINSVAAGVIGLYRRDSTERCRAWIGWFGITHAYRHKGYAVEALRKLFQYAKSEGFTELYVYTDPVNSIAIKTYERAGFVKQYLAPDPGTGRSVDPSGLVLAHQL